VAADGMLYFRYENGKMALVKASPDKFELKGSFDIPEKSGSPSWQHPVIANGKLYLRDQDKLHCFDVKKK
jgi:outer membrane protein assembly factor BamB